MSKKLNLWIYLARTTVCFLILLSSSSNIYALNSVKISLSAKSKLNSKELKKLKNISNVALKNIREQLSNNFRFSPSKEVKVYFITPLELRAKTKVSKWTTGAYINNTIFIPINGKVLSTQITSTLRHEYTHHFIKELSIGSAPAWLDEGLAQIYDEKPSTLSSNDFKLWIKRNKVIPISMLKEGLSSSSKQKALAAYKTSYLAAKELVRQFGYQSIKKYLNYLALGKNPLKSFKLAFNISFEKFSNNFNEKVKKT